MDLNIKIIKTTELTFKELVQISQIFRLSFQKNVEPILLYMKYTSNIFGFSFHALVRNSKDNLIGIYTFSPRIFLLNEKKLKHYNH